ncbi:HNH endonuclease [Rhodococcus sp. CX]|uniref:HNH endonuclease n=1 Tax=Rhodococcus sp. CX TaxID=2789880 RepID=UPI0018CDC0F2|nr:HNH endonuclease [Rhodococcus sp. CX]MBH0121542.1 HNH endonuclease [Rhodococcus sp. CX]
MAVSKRQRYEILRRDNHACRYCGATAPDVKLVVDHVIPQALGGSDEPSNLITACDPCNSGKSATIADAPVVSDVDERAAQWSSAMRQAAEEISADSRLVNTVCERVDEIMPGYRPVGWRNSIQQILAAGLPDEVIVDMAHVAMDAYGVNDRWKYFFGCCWIGVRKLQGRATELLDAPNHAQTHAPSNAPSNAWSTSYEYMLDVEIVEREWEDVNALFRQHEDAELPKCLCLADECSAGNALLCRYGLAKYMLGWIAHRASGGALDGPGNPSEVSDGTALDPA